MNINYDYLKTFYLVAINQSISRAAKIIGVSQPAVTQSIQNLEKQLDGKLFNRSKKGVTLTEEGRELFSYVEEGMIIIENGIKKFSDLHNLDAGKIKVGANPAINKHILMPILKKYHELYPNVEVIVVNESTTNLLKFLRQGTIDLVFMSVPRKEIADYDITSFMDIQDVFIANDTYYEKTKEITNINDLLQLPIIVEENPSISRAYFDLLLRSRNLDCTPSKEVDSQELLINYVSNGFGIGFATKEYIQDELDQKKVYVIDVGQIPKRRVGFAKYSKSNLNIGTNKLIELIKSEQK